MTPNESTGQRVQHWARLPPPEILAVVVTAPVPDIPPSSLRDVLEPVVVDRRVVGWTLTDDAGSRPEVFREFWTWRRTWTSTWSMGSVLHLRALLDTVEQLHVGPGPLLTVALEQLCRAEHHDEELVVVGAVQAEDADALVDDLQALRSILTSVNDTGWALVDDMGLPSRGTGILRTWPDVDDDVVLAADQATSVIIEPGGGLAVVHGDDLTHTFRFIERGDLTGDVVVLTDAGGGTLELTPDRARPLGWIAPGSLRWHVEPIALVELWRPLFDGLPAAIAAARRSGTGVRFTSGLAAS